MYPTGRLSATLPLDHPGLVASCPPRPAPVGAGAAGGMVAVRLADLAAAPGDGSGVRVPAGGVRPIRDGDLVAWCVVVTVAAAVLDAEGRISAEGWLPDHVRLGVLEPHLGDGVVEQVVASAGAAPQERRRLMSLPLVARLVVAMTLLPNSSYVDVMAHVVGLLPRLPWRLAWRVPSSTVFTTWRRRLGVAAMRDLFWRLAGPVVAEGEPGARWRGLEVCALDGSQVRVPDTPANRAAFGSSGTSDDSAPFPQVRMVVATARAGRAILAARFAASRVGEQMLTARLVEHHPHLFGVGYLLMTPEVFPHGC